MNIKQASKQSGVSAPNIRFYEKEGLLNPARLPGNDYRDYTEQDIRALRFIRMLSGFCVRKLRTHSPKSVTF